MYEIQGKIKPFESKGFRRKAAIAIRIELITLVKI
jgi:hypothetical protein